MTEVAPIIHRYLARLGLSESPPATLAGLTDLVARHMLAVPFENVDIVRGRHIVLSTESAVEKVVGRERGGFCFEVNEAFRALLEALGFSVYRVEGQVWLDANNAFGAPFDHLALVVTLPEGEFLVDVGFGDNNRRPLRLPADETSDLSGNYRLRDAGDGALLLERTRGGATQRLYRMTLDPRPLSAFEAMCAYHQTSLDSIFTSGLICTRATATGRITLAKDRLIVADGSEREETPVAAHQVDEMLSTHFGIGRD